MPHSRSPSQMWVVHTSFGSGCVEFPLERNPPGDPLGGPGPTPMGSFRWRVIVCRVFGAQIIPAGGWWRIPFSEVWHERWRHLRHGFESHLWARLLLVCSRERCGELFVANSMKATSWKTERTLPLLSGRQFWEGWPESKGGGNPGAMKERSPLAKNHSSSCIRDFVDGDSLAPQKHC